MNKPFHSPEFAQSPVKSTQTYAKGDRVRLLATGALGTVSYALHSHRGHFVTIKMDKTGLSRVYLANEIARVEALF